MLVLGLIAGMILLVVAAGYLLVRLRKRASEQDSASVGLALDDLRGLRQSGQLSDVEYETLRKAITARSIAAMDAKAAARAAVGKRPLPNPGDASRSGAAPTPPDPSLNNERRARPGFDLTGRPLPKTPPAE